MMVSRFALLSVVLAGLGGVAGAAEAPMIGFVDPNFATCHARTYDDAHMKAHPKQKVTGIAFVYAPNGSTEAADEGAISAALVVTLKGSKEKLYGSAYCKADGANAIDCIIDEDGGSFKLAQASDKGHLLTNANGFRVGPDTGDHDSYLEKRVLVDPKDDHATFQLPDTKGGLCDLK